LSIIIRRGYYSGPRRGVSVPEGPGECAAVVLDFQRDNLIALYEDQVHLAFLGRAPVVDAVAALKIIVGLDAFGDDALLFLYTIFSSGSDTSVPSL